MVNQWIECLFALLLWSRFLFQLTFKSFGVFLLPPFNQTNFDILYAHFCVRYAITLKL